MAEQRCPDCGSEVAPSAHICVNCRKRLGEQALSPYERQALRDAESLEFERGSKTPKRHGSPTTPGWYVAWLLGLVVILLFRERASAVFKMPAVPPLVAAVILVLGLPGALRSRRPRSSSLAVIGIALVVVVLWLRPTDHVPWTPWLLPLVLLTLVLFLLPEASTFHDPGSFRTGLLMVATAVGSFWPAHSWIAALELGFREYNLALHGVALFFGASLFFGGVWFLSTAGGSETTAEALRCPECARPTVRATLRTPDAVHYCCEACDHLWTIQKRRG